MVFLKIATGCGLNDDEEDDDGVGLTALTSSPSVWTRLLLLVHRCLLWTGSSVVRLVLLEQYKLKGPY
jgi:hypothetical protein